MHFIYFVLLVLLFTGLLSWLNYRLLARLFPFYRRRPIRYGYLLVTAAALLITCAGWLLRLSAVELGSGYYFLLYAALGWLIGQFSLILLQPLLFAIVRLLERGSKKAPEQGDDSAVMTRRSFLRGASAVLPIAAVGIGPQGIYQAQTGMVVRGYTLSVAGLPQDLQGFKIVQLSDTHLGQYFGLERLESTLQLILRQAPDLLVITGDFADDMNLFKFALERLDKFQPLIPRGIYFCLGNHEYYRNVDLVRAGLARSKVVLLENSSSLIVPGERPLYLLGVDYPGADDGQRGMQISVSRRQQYFTAANRDIPGDAVKVLIAHHPDFLFDGFAARIPLTLAGHTHGGQVVLGGKSLFYSHQYVRGLFEENGVYGYVSSGAGHWFPFRLGCPPEISVFTLQA